MDFKDVLAARESLAQIANLTPVHHSRWLAGMTGAPVWMKCENFQRTGSFKIRGAYLRISRIPEAERAKGVVAASAGNHAQGVALAARELGAKATIFMPEGAAIPKVDATRAYGADVKFAGANIGTALIAAQEFAKETGATLIHPFDHQDIVIGQGTVGPEIIEQVPDVDTILVPVGGGGLIAGISLLRQERPDIKIIGVQTEKAASYSQAFAKGHPVEIELGVTMADGIAVGRPGDIPFELVSKYVDEVITVQEESISTALMLLLERAKLLVEPSGAVGVAAILENPDRFNKTTVPVLSGGNIDSIVLLQVVRHGLVAAGRFLNFRVRIPDRPGELMQLLAHLASMDVNVQSVTHDRTSAALGVGETGVQLQVATRGIEHRENVMSEIKDLGYLTY